MGLRRNTPKKSFFFLLPNPPKPPTLHTHPPKKFVCFCNNFPTFMCYVSLIPFQLFKIAMFHY
jgi:hypothetical protein